VARVLELDWVIVRVVTLRRAVAVGVTGLVAAGLVVFAYLRLNLPPDARARHAIERAESSHARLMQQQIPAAWGTEIGQAEGQLEVARSAYALERWEESYEHAESARSRFEALLGVGSHELIGVGQFFSLNGRVTVQRAGKSEWTGAHQRMPVFNGDFVKTDRDGSAEILFIDGTLYRIAPSSLLEIHHQSAQKQSAVKMIVGQINVHTSDSTSTVTTNTTETRVQRDSRVAVDVSEDSEETKVAALSGRARVRTTVGREVLVAPREEVAARADGTLSDKRRLPDPPVPLEPHANAGFELSSSPVIQLRWRRSSSSDAIHLQVSRTPQFVSGQLDVDAAAIKRDHARLKAVAPGTYFWRLATVAGGTLRSEWSPVRRFQIWEANREVIFDDRQPPALELQPIQQMGSLFILEGRTEPGAAVTVDGEEVGVDSEGRFRTTVEANRVGWNELVVVASDPSGNRSEQRRRVYVEGF
jgi:hypothetical protein